MNCIYSLHTSDERQNFNYFVLQNYFICLWWVIQLTKRKHEYQNCSINVWEVNTQDLICNNQNWKNYMGSCWLLLQQQAKYRSAYTAHIDNRPVHKPHIYNANKKHANAKLQVDDKMKVKLSVCKQNFTKTCNGRDGKTPFISVIYLCG